MYANRKVTEDCILKQVEVLSRHSAGEKQALGGSRNQEYRITRASFYGSDGGGDGW